MSTDLDVLVIETIVGWSSHLETAGEICLRLADQGHKVGFVYLGYDNPDEGIRQDPTLWEYLHSPNLNKKVNQFSNLIESRGIQIGEPLKIPSSILDEIDSFCSSIPNDIDALRTLSYKGANIGLGVLSSVISKTKSSQPKIDEHQELITKYVKSGLKVFEQTLMLIDEYKPESLVTFNGRFALSKAIWEAAKISDTKIFFHERGADYTRFVLKDSPIHDFSHTRKLIRSHWADTNSEKKEVAHNFFIRRKKGDGIGWYSFIDQQKENQVPIMSGDKKIVYFSSSDDEYAAVGDMVNHPIFASQREAVIWLIDFVSNYSDVELLIRVHPHLLHKSADERLWWHSLSGKNVTIVETGDTVDSYALAQQADKVVTYGSTMGVEATYWGSPSILLGDALYRGLDCVYEPSSLKEAKSLLQDKHLDPLPKEHCLPYGYYFLTYGDRYKFYNPTSLSSGTFLGQKLSGDSFLIKVGKNIRLRTRIRNLLNIITKWSRYGEGLHRGK